ncbi:MAG: thioredoxin domain-containing protein [Patescibacteria group bacterium]|nr:thioredoxin domain-containing protein [Patescibacteria group bacterium]
MEPNKAAGSLLSLPGAIIIAAAIIAIAIIWTQQRPSSAPAGSAQPQPSLPQVNMAPVTAADHIFGNPSAPIKIVEYSDPSCPFCKMFNSTMESVMAQYGPSGKVAWVYRQFPLDAPDANGNVLHPLAGTQAQAFECAASLGGNAAFWKYEHAWFDAFPTDGAGESSSLDSGQMDQAAAAAGLDKQAFDACVASGSFKGKIDAEYAGGVNAGVTGTPYIVIVTPSGSKIALAGAQSYATMKTSIDTLLSAASSTAQ